MGLVVFFFPCWQQRGSLFWRGQQQVPGFNLPLVCLFIYLLLQPIAYGPGAGQDCADHSRGADAPLGTGAMGSSLLQSSSRGLNPPNGSTSIHNVPRAGGFWQLFPMGTSERAEDISRGVAGGGQRLLQAYQDLPQRNPLRWWVRVSRACARIVPIHTVCGVPQPLAAPGKPMGSW